jgi:DNA-binding transcriptional MerR regulator
MPDYILEDHLIQRLELSQMDLQGFEQRGIIQGVEKNGYVFYSSREFYRLKGVLHYMRSQGLSLDEARAKVDLVTTH